MLWCSGCGALSCVGSSSWMCGLQASTLIDFQTPRFALKCFRGDPGFLPDRKDLVPINVSCLTRAGLRAEPPIARRECHGRATTCLGSQTPRAHGIRGRPSDRRFVHLYIRHAFAGMLAPERVPFDGTQSSSRRAVANSTHSWPNTMESAVIRYSRVFVRYFRSVRGANCLDVMVMFEHLTPGPVGGVA